MTLPPTEVTVAIIGLLSVSISSFVSYHVSKKAAHAEVEKLKLTWKHDREIEFDADFSNMMTAVTLFIKKQTWTSFNDAVKSVNVVRVKVDGDLAQTLDKLMDSFGIYQNGISQNIPQLNICLKAAIEQKRISTREKDA